jgi:hypothetical protein
MKNKSKQIKRPVADKSNQNKNEKSSVRSDIKNE